MTGRIVLAATPIGNVDDSSQRLRDALATADVIAAEDTRRLRDLTARLGIRTVGEVVAHHDHNEAASAAGLVERAAAGDTVLVVSDAGMPAVSDPGFRVVEAAARAGVDVTVLPGPSAALTALALSGLPTDRFCFEGFLPRKAGERAGRLASLALEERTMLFFEAPHRLAATLEAMAGAFGADRPAAVSRELTKTYEETRRGTLAELHAWAAGGEPRGEIVVTVAGRPAERLGTQALVAEVLARVEAGERAKAAVADVAAAAGVPSRELYAAVLAARSGG
ncbi:16S rRNA (cytidine(1402)-2'-O)-methyltransferase [Demequina lignilytica]|uniref:Ribosomal RNA small subunit methyltransferase I n=1 Tax=Demequina lignilytica TaxID=3051663 RepID=A0AAW7M468_9MICO|nr:MULTISPECIES: 16S rRNA (cytidine(1402)-2'-O)-methyltransferase [unclassified Demequina]MDN4477569.1 16S rRNA (cytidine(1402)-2'-O)-methyltransferase [Demequina sp. SYSU T00039-1]MDN4483613.1 16S rRNA (cytidine(1402)-2'-O)-methyltransferase [Demequina sp. SYSU T0a273]MDN4488080.1 16S rRNA (cytidine(1402)-2'-O)-methyltransferase [Demequina sp. SYSU T00039]